MRARRFKGSRLSDRQEESIFVVPMEGADCLPWGVWECLGEHCGLFLVETKMPTVYGCIFLMTFISLKKK